MNFETKNMQVHAQTGAVVARQGIVASRASKVNAIVGRRLLVTQGNGGFPGTSAPIGRRFRR